MGFGRELSIRVLVGAIALASGYSVGAPPLGASRQSEISKDENKLITSYESCARRLEDIGTAAEILDPAAPAPSLDARPSIPLTVSFRQKSLSLELLPGVRLMGLALAHSPAQAFLMASRETYHKMVTDVARFGGYYLLFPLASTADTKLVAFLRSRFAIIDVASPENQLTGEIALVPVNQAPAFARLLNGKDAAATYVTDVTVTEVPEYYPLPYSEGVVRTGRGTTYVFGRGGAVSVFNRRGGTQEFRIGNGHKAYSSHAAILERQGVRLAPRDPVKALEVALARNDAAIAKHSEVSGISKTERGIHAAEMEDLRSSYSEAQGRWAESEKGRLLNNLLNLAASRNYLLPEFLRMTALAQSDLLTAPTDENGEMPRRVLRRFIAIRNPAGLQEYPFGVDLRLVHDDCMHLQAVHAALGSMALPLDQEGLIAGGILAFTYSETGALEAIEIEDNGFISMAHGERVRHELFPDEIAFMAKQLCKALSGGPAAGARIFGSEADRPAPTPFVPAE